MEPNYKIKHKLLFFFHINNKENNNNIMVDYNILYKIQICYALNIYTLIINKGVDVLFNGINSSYDY